MENIAWYVFVFLMVIYVLSMFRTANENERFAVFVAGKCVALKGPGLIVQAPGPGKKLIKITLGERGVYLGNALAAFNGVSFPVEASNIEPEDSVQVSSFRERKIWIAQSTHGVRTIVCHDCGHEINLPEGKRA